MSEEACDWRQCVYGRQIWSMADNSSLPWKATNQLMRRMEHTVCLVLFLLFMHTHHYKMLSRYRKKEFVRSLSASSSSWPAANSPSVTFLLVYLCLLLLCLGTDLLSLRGSITSSYLCLGSLGCQKMMFRVGSKPWHTKPKLHMIFCLTQRIINFHENRAN